MQPVGSWLPRIRWLPCPAEGTDSTAARMGGGAQSGRNDLPVLEELCVDERERCPLLREVVFEDGLDWADLGAERRSRCTRPG